MTFRIFGAQPVVEQADVPIRQINAAAECQSCYKPVAARIVVVRDQPGTQVIMGNLVAQSADISAMGLGIGGLWPEQQKASIADRIPQSVRKALQQAETNYCLPDCEDAAATMYRRALDTALKEAFPDVKGDVFKRIERLVEMHEFPRSLGEWAHEVRLIGNDGAHDLEGVTREDLSAARDFVDAVLRYSFTLPQMIAERRALAAHEAVAVEPPPA